ncbi:MAG: 16S rRNA (uracil(1498)-N(3))-methyltransferase [Ignavibacteriae bacterium]|nr:16S rRNA (uracil(1498)-N(3))-methyltransferase [Ignavibacteriota bacterium]
MNIIILSEKDRLNENQYRIDDERYSHIINILNSELNDFVEIGLLNNKIGIAKIILIDEKKLILEIVELYECDKSKISIDLICALPRPQTLKKVLSISATMRVRNLFFIKSEKVEKSYFHSPLLFEDNYTKYLVEGLSQGKQIFLPNVSFHNKFKIFFEDEFNSKNYDRKLLAHPNSENSLLKFKFSEVKNLVVAIGPEGGWNNFEINFMQNLDFENFILSKSILRVESAVTAALSQIELITKL